MEETIKELEKEMLNKEFELVEMDNMVEQITGSTTSLFDCEEDCIQQLSCAYYMAEDKYIVVDFNIIEKDENNLYTKIKVENIWEN